MKKITPLVNFAVFLILILFLASPAEAYRPRKYFKKILPPPEYEQRTMTGTWGGLRDDMYESGITVASTYVCDVLGNVSGGKDKGVRYDHSMGLDINMDLEEMADMEGLQFHVSGLYRAGRNLSTDVIGNKFTTSSIFGHEQFRFYSLYLEQSLFEDKLNIRAGRMGAADDFTQSDIYWLYVNNAIDGCPISIPLNFAYPVYPTATWGIRSKVHLTDTFYATTGIYDADPAVGRDEYYGLDFSLRLSQGILAMQEFAFTPNTEKGATGMPGHYKVGGFVLSGRFDDLYSDASGAAYVLSGNAPRKHKANYGLYFHADQMLYREKPASEEEVPSDQGLSAFGVVTLAPSNTNMFPFFFDGGVFYKGLIPGRDEDVTAFGIAYGRWSQDITYREQTNNDVLGLSVDPPKYELMLEFTNKIQITEWMFLQPDMQLIFHPGGTSKIPTAYVIGSRFGVSF
ncbi:carbohydrate porin [Candidatus Omnitrophota bacterium]